MSDQVLAPPGTVMLSVAFYDDAEREKLLWSCPGFLDT
jgi:hypothetical protein